MRLGRDYLALDLLLLTICLERVGSVIYSPPARRTSNVMVPKASLTQKGYIQFLKYVVDVPELTDYTFCIWVRSNNLTYNHPLLSYSKHEEERLIRVWISPLGTHINLELLGTPIFSYPVNLVENEWYHVCQSWSSFHAAWSLFVNGRLQASGHAPKLKAISIQSGGDLVVGQEYTDFDKGLDDGIEGDISGFNLVLASTFNGFDLNRAPINHLFKREISIRRPLFDANDLVPSRGLDLNFIGQPLPLESPQIQPPSTKTSYEPPVYGYYQQELRDYIDKPLGLLLVQLSNDCGYLRGAPLSGKGVLVSWTKTEVRVFGGAILKTAPPFCAAK